LSDGASACVVMEGSAAAKLSTPPLGIFKVLKRQELKGFLSFLRSFSFCSLALVFLFSFFFVLYFCSLRYSFTS
jgi:hypothetical protein